MWEHSLSAVMQPYPFWLRSFSEFIRLWFKKRLPISGSFMSRQLAVWQAMASVSSDSFPSLVPAFRMLISSGRALRASVIKQTKASGCLTQASTWKTANDSQDHRGFGGNNPNLTSTLKQAVYKFHISLHFRCLKPLWGTFIWCWL